jgi:hypothetical protein
MIIKRVQLGISLEVAIGISNFPSVIVAVFLGELGVSGLRLKFPEKVPVIRVAVIEVMVMVKAFPPYRVTVFVAMSVFRVIPQLQEWSS